MWRSFRDYSRARDVRRRGRPLLPYLVRSRNESRRQLGGVTDLMQPTRVSFFLGRFPWGRDGLTSWVIRDDARASSLPLLLCNRPRKFTYPPPQACNDLNNSVITLLYIPCLFVHLL